jgi:predicted dehydrogenase
MRIGILSFAHHHAESYILNLRKLPEVTQVGIADEDNQRGQKFADQYNIPFYSTYEELLAVKPDGILICSENNKHREMVEMAAHAGVNVLCEKPLATTVEDSQAMVDACNNAGVILMTAFPMRFSTPLIQVKRSIDAGDFGKIFCFNATNQGELPSVYREWFVDPILAGGGALMDHTVHLVDIMRWYLSSEVIEVYAQTNQIFHADEVMVETGGLEMIKFKNGVFATIDASWSRPDYWPTWGGLTFELITEKGAILVDAFSQNLTIYRDDWQRAGWSYWGSDANQAMVNEFVSAVKENRPPAVTGWDGLKAVEVTLAAYESAKTNQPVYL